MISRGSLWLPFAILLLLALLSFWIERAVHGNGDNGQSAGVEPEGIMENFDAMRTDPTGRPRYRLSAARLKHYSGSKRTELESPRFVQLDPELGEIRAVADQATISPDGDEVELRGNVVVERAASADHPAMVVRTAQLLVFPDRNLLHAPGRVFVQDGSHTVEAGAMEYDAERRVIKLSGRVQARFIPGKG